MTVGLGWLQGTTRTADRDALTARLGAIFGEVRERASGLQWYRESATVGGSGVVVGWAPRSASSLASEVFVMVPQSALDALGCDGSLALLGELVEDYGLRPSRLDIYLDDRARLADPADVLDAIERGQVRSHVRAWRTVRDSTGGMTTYLGSRQGDAMVRVYRKWAESGDPEQGVRWEMECRGERAQLVTAMVLPVASSVGLAGVYLGLLRAFVDFVQRGEGQRGDRAPLLGWWAALVGSAGRVGPVLARVKDSLQRRREWVRRQVAPSLALLFAVDGSDGVSDIIREGWDRAPWAVLSPAPRWFAAGGAVAG
jgi:hypothetical protein